MAWHVDYIPADFTAVALGIREAETCAEAGKMIAHGRAILRVPAPRGWASAPCADGAGWQRSLKAHKKHCKWRA